MVFINFWDYLWDRKINVLMLRNKKGLYVKF